MRGKNMGREARAGISDRALWRRSRTTDAVEDDAARYLDLAAFADGRLDPDEEDRVAEWLARHPDAGQDIAAARRLASVARYEAPPEAVVARACAIAGGGRKQPQSAVVRLHPIPRKLPMLRTAARWSSLAAALVVAGWLGFTLGMDASATVAQAGRAAEDGLLQDLFGPSPGSMRDLTGGA